MYEESWGRLISHIVRNPSIVKNGYTPDSIWRNRDTFLNGHDEIVEFLTKKWSVENGYRLRKELFAFTDNKVSHVLRSGGRNKIRGMGGSSEIETFVVHEDG